MTRLLCALVLAAVAAAAAASAAAADVSRAELRALAERAGSDRRALDRLRDVDAVEGRPVNIRAALEGAEGSDLDRRLRLLAERGPPAPSSTPSAAARAEAREVLSERRFRPGDGLRPFRGVLEWLSRGVGPVVEAILNVLGAIEAFVPGGDLVLWVAAAVLVAVLAAWLARRAIRNRTAAEGEPRPPRPADPLDPRTLERDAEAAERRGELELALRLRFRAGLLRLDRARRIPFRESMTSGEVSRRLRSPDFDAVAAAFDEIVYGGRPAVPDDLAAARDRWGRVLAEAA